MNQHNEFVMTRCEMPGTDPARVLKGLLKVAAQSFVLRSVSIRSRSKASSNNGAEGKLFRSSRELLAEPE